MRAPDQTRPAAAKRHRSQRFQERTRFIRHLEVAVIDVTSIRSDQVNGPARALMHCLLGGWMTMGQLDGLATTIRFRLSSRACEGAWAGPDATTVGVVFAGLMARPNPLPTLIAYRGCLPVGRSGRDDGRWCLHGSLPAHTVPSWVAGVPGKLGTADAPPARSVKSGRKRLAVCGHDADPLEERRRDKPQYRVRKSTRFCCRDAGLVLAMHAGDEAASMDDDMNQPRWLKVGRDRPQLCARESQ